MVQLNLPGSVAGERAERIHFDWLLVGKKKRKDQKTHIDGEQE